MTTQSKPLPRLSHAATLIHPLCQALSRRNNLLDRPHLYPPHSLESKRQHHRNTPIYRSFFKHRLFDKNMLGLIKEYLTHTERLAVCEYGNSHRVRILDPVSGECLRVICGDGWGSGDNQLSGPFGGAVDSQSRLFVGDTFNNRVQVFDVESGEFLRTLGETGVRGSDEKHFINSAGIAIDSKDNVYVCDSGNSRVCVFDASLKFVRSFGQNVLKVPLFACFNSRGQVLVIDTALSQVVVFNKRGERVHAIGSHGAADGQFNTPSQIAVDSQDRLFVADKENHRIQVFDSDFKHLISIGSHTSMKEDGKFNDPTCVAVNASNTELFVGDASRVQVFSMRPDSTKFVFLRSFGGEYNSSQGSFRLPTSLCFF